MPLRGGVMKLSHLAAGAAGMGLILLAGMSAYSSRAQSPSEAPWVSQNNAPMPRRGNPDGWECRGHRHRHGRPGGGNNRGCNGNRYGGRMYDPARVETIRGEAIAIETFDRGGRGRGGGTHVQVRANNETFTVRLGPSWYLSQRNFQLQPNQIIEVTGSRVDWNGQPTLIAAEVTQGNQTIQLRDENGIPLWSRGRHRGWDNDNWR